MVSLWSKTSFRLFFECTWLRISQTFWGKQFQVSKIYLKINQIGWKLSLDKYIFTFKQILTPTPPPCRQPPCSVSSISHSLDLPVHPLFPFEQFRRVDFSNRHPHVSDFLRSSPPPPPQHRQSCSIDLRLA